MPAIGPNQVNDMELTNEDVERILRIIDESGYDEIRIEHGDLKIYMRRRGGGDRRRSEEPTGQPAAAAPPEPQATPEATKAPAVMAKAPGANEVRIPEGLVAVRAPMLGTFYRAPAPGAPPFTEEGATVQADSTVCLLEVMKLFNTLKAGVAGRVVRFLVENGQMVEYDQPILLIEPAAKG